MAKIRITSNPYRREIKFDLLDKASSEWIEINYQNNSGSKLIKGEIKKNFFPYKVREIVDILLNEYGANEGKLELVFAGSMDEYRELEEVCSDFPNVDVQMDSMRLENARDILPKIIDVFTNIKEIADANIESPAVQALVDCDVNKFIDASKEFKKETNNNILEEKNIDNIIEEFRNRADVEYFSRYVDNSEIEENDYNLSVSTYVEKEDTREKIDIKVLNKEIAETVKKIDELRASIDEIVRELEGDE